MRLYYNLIPTHLPTYFFVFVGLRVCVQQTDTQRDHAPSSSAVVVLTLLQSEDRITLHKLHSA